MNVLASASSLWHRCSEAHLRKYRVLAGGGSGRKPRISTERPAEARYRNVARLQPSSIEKKKKCYKVREGKRADRQTQSPLQFRMKAQKSIWQGKLHFFQCGVTKTATITSTMTRQIEFDRNGDEEDAMLIFVARLCFPITYRSSLPAGCTISTRQKLTDGAGRIVRSWWKRYERVPLHLPPHCIYTDALMHR